jgi:single-stranded DNA-binding protein
LIHNHTRRNQEGKYERTGKTTSMRTILWQVMLEGRQFGKGDLLGVTGYLKERHWTDQQGQNYWVNELVVTGITKHLPKGMGKPQAQPQQMEMPVVTEAEAARPKRKPHKGIIRVGASL